MNLARVHAEQGGNEGYVVQAAEQTGGRGRRGNQWTSPVGNLYQSIVLRPLCDKHLWGQLSFVVAVALADAAFACGANAKSLKLKWPNDVLINEQKLAGILIEAHDDFLILGTGVNIMQSPEDRAKVNDFCDLSVQEFRDIFLEKIHMYYTQWNKNGFDDIRQKWLVHAYKFGETIQARLPNAIYEGIFEALDPQGILLLREKDGTLRHIHSGEILAHVTGH